jgi:hypothetical protein
MADARKQFRGLMAGLCPHAEKLQMFCDRHARRVAPARKNYRAVTICTRHARIIQCRPRLFHERDGTARTKRGLGDIDGK